MDELAVYKRAVTIAAEMFSTAGYVLYDGDSPASVDEVRRFLLRKARKELKEVRRDA